MPQAIKDLLPPPHTWGSRRCSNGRVNARRHGRQRQVKTAVPDHHRRDQRTGSGSCQTYNPLFGTAPAMPTIGAGSRHAAASRGRQLIALHAYLVSSSDMMG